MQFITHVGTPSTPIPLAQPWLDTKQPNFQSTHARFNWSDTNLHVHVELQDAAVFSASTGHNQSLFQLGDTAELFLMLPDAPQYHEFHVSPHNHRANLRWPLGGIETVRNEGVTFENFRENPDAFDSRVHLVEHGWEVDFDIPASLLGLEKFTVGQSLLVSVSRYDYSDLKTAPVVSTISAHKIKNFHRFEDWLTMELV